MMPSMLVKSRSIGLFIPKAKLFPRDKKYRELRKKMKREASKAMRRTLRLMINESVSGESISELDEQSKWQLYQQSCDDYDFLYDQEAQDALESAISV